MSLILYYFKEASPKNRSLFFGQSMHVARSPACWHVLNLNFNTCFQMGSLCCMCVPWGDVCQMQLGSVTVVLSNSGSFYKILPKLFFYSTIVRCRWHIFVHAFILLKVATSVEVINLFSNSTVPSTVTSVNDDVTKSCEALPASLTFAALQRVAVSISELVSWAAVKAVILCCADNAVCSTGLTASPHRVEEPLWTDIPTLTMKAVPDHPKLI